MRDDLWLKNRLEYIRQNHFSDIEYGNDIMIQFGRYSKTRLGSIALRRKGQEKRRLLTHEVRYLKSEEAISIITVNKHFESTDIPEEIVDSVIAHEFCHYTQGFNSTLPKKQKHPHKGGVIHKELDERGLGEIIRLQKKWVKDNWRKIIG